MGGCLSTPEPPSGAANAQANLQKTRLQSNSSGHAVAAAAKDEAGQAQPADGARALSRNPSALRLELIGKVHVLQQELALVSTHPLLAIPEAAELLLQHLAVDVIGIYAFVEDGGRACGALLTAQGSGAQVLERQTVLHGDRWSGARLMAAAPGTDDGRRLLVLDAAGCQESDLPDDFMSLYREAGMRSLVAVPVGPPGGRPLGAMLLGMRRPGGLDQKWASVWLSAAATGLLQHMRHGQVAQAARMIRCIEEVEDPVAAISVLLQSGARFMFRCTNILMGVRLAVLRDRGAGGAPGIGASSALVFQSARAATSSNQDSMRYASAAVPSDPTADLTVRELTLDNTLLASAVSLKKARFVKDCASYLQNAPAPARDVFTHSSQPVSSVVVVPLLAEDEVLGALYFTQDTPCDFSNIQEALLGFVHAVTLTLNNKLRGQMAVLQGMVDRAHKPKSLDLIASGALGGNLIRQINDSDHEDDSSEPSTSANSIVPPMSRSSTNGRLSKVSSRRLCTEAMLQVLQQEIRKGKRRSVELSFVGDHLVISEPIGHGGFGRVYRGSWHKRPAAIKVMHSRSSDSEAVSDAMEMAVLSSVQHPNIVQVYSCLTDMVEIAPVGSSELSSCSSAAPSAGAPRMPHYRRIHPGEDDDVPTYNIVVMEYCNRGTLGEAVKRGGLFHRRLPGGGAGVDLSAVLDILIDVAGSLEYLHGIGLMHGDIKLDNVLLKTDPLRPLGFVSKLADFGLTKIVRDAVHVVNHNGAGTVTHLAPEMFQAGTRVTTAVDTYAFGVMMWEFYTGQRPYAGLNQEAIIDCVLRRGARPTFPSGAPREYADLATACWAPCPVDRPSFSDIVCSLQRMSDALAEVAAQQQQQQRQQQWQQHLEQQQQQCNVAAAPPTDWVGAPMPVHWQQHRQQQQQQQQQCNVAAAPPTDWVGAPTPMPMHLQQQQQQPPQQQQQQQPQQQQQQQCNVAAAPPADWVGAPTPMPMHLQQQPQPQQHQQQQQQCNVAASPPADWVGAPMPVHLQQQQQPQPQCIFGAPPTADRFGAALPVQHGAFGRGGFGAG